LLLNPGASYSIPQQDGHYYPSSDGAGGSGTYQVWDVTTATSDLMAGTTSAATFTDLGSGLFYGSQTFSSADNGAFFTIDLNSDFISAAQSALGSSDIVVGGAVASGGGYMFGWSGGISPDDTYLALDITPVPEPSTMALAAAGGAVLLMFGRRRK